MVWRYSGIGERGRGRRDRKRKGRWYSGIGEREGKKEERR